MRRKRVCHAADSLGEFFEASRIGKSDEGIERRAELSEAYKGPKYIVVTGGVMSGVGKGLTTASLGKILQAHGYRAPAVKIDPYINYDAGTMRPT
ncbi:MAG: hypothetical protein HOC74_23470, partial [Gemmatimonadetes bacterium]|nr:hypothetical protein [Gemmatimonadota bacterium]